MKRATHSVHIESLIININSQTAAPALPVLSFLGTTVSTNDSAMPVSSGVPALGEYWPGEGGFNGGLVAARGDVPAHYLIVGKEDLGKFEWGGRGTECVATSKTDGLSNTKALCNDEHEHPAANACAEHQADGHHDFYLPACAELYHCWVNVPELFTKDTWYWSSTQRSAYIAFCVYFDDGGQNVSGGKSFELRVRPVRRLFI